MTVAVLPFGKAKSIQISDSDLEWKFCRGSGKGGQNRNKRDTAVRLTHVPTGISVWCEEERSQGKNKDIAYQKLYDILHNNECQKKSDSRRDMVREQIADTSRSHRVRTVKEKLGVVVNNDTGRSIPLSHYQKGKFKKLLK